MGSVGRYSGREGRYMFNLRHSHTYYQYQNVDVDAVFETYNFYFRKEEVKEERRNV
jgi:hypothetical protein